MVLFVDLTSAVSRNLLVVNETMVTSRLNQSRGGVTLVKAGLCSVTSQGNNIRVNGTNSDEVKWFRSAEDLRTAMTFSAIHYLE